MSTEMEVMKLKEQLVQAQNALVKQTERCQQLVRELTKRLQENNCRYLYEKHLRDSQLAKVLKALLLMEARLKREQNCIAHQLNEKDSVIRKQKEEIKKMLCNQYCRNCDQIFKSGFQLERPEYINYQNSGVNPFVASVELIALADEYNSSNESFNTKAFSSNEKITHDLIVEFHQQKNESHESVRRKMEETEIRDNFKTASVGFELSSNNTSPFSNENDTVQVYDNFNYLPTKSLVDQIYVEFQEGKKLCDQEPLKKDINYHNTDKTVNLSFLKSNITVIHNIPISNLESSTDILELEDCRSKSVENNIKGPENKLSEAVSIFDVEGESNDTWYITASDQEDEQLKNIYKNNPVLECVNQILLKNIDTEYDILNTPLSSPKPNRLSKKKNKFLSGKLSLSEEHYINEQQNDYYETPIHKMGNFYETPQSIYGNDYEQIRSKCSDSSSGTSLRKHDQEKYNQQISDMRKNKMLITPPTLPPKPANLVSKYRIQINSLTFSSDKMNDRISVDSEPDYCSISELNLPTHRLMKSENFRVITKMNAPVLTELKYEDELSPPTVESSKPNDYDVVNAESSDMWSENINRWDLESSIQATISTNSAAETTEPFISLCNNIPKLPSVSEVIIPEDTEEKTETIITLFNYEKINSQLPKTNPTISRKKPIKIGSSVSSIIMGFSNKELLYEIDENVHNISRQLTTYLESERNNGDFNFNQNFEEFNLDECEFDEYILNTTEIKRKEISERDGKSKKLEIDQKLNTFRNIKEIKSLAEEVAGINLKSQYYKVFLEKLQCCDYQTKQLMKDNDWKNETAYEYFLDCTGLSSKSISTQSKLTENHRSHLKSSSTSSEIHGATVECNVSNVKYWTE